MRRLNIFFDVDDTLIFRPNRLRNHAQEVFERITEAGHAIFVWSGNGIRRYEMEQHGLDHFVDDYFVKPLERYREQLSAFNVYVEPDFVVDDHQGVVDAFGGYHISLYAGEDEREMLNVLEAIEQAALNDGPR